MEPAGRFAAAIHDKDRAGFVLRVDEANEVAVVGLQAFPFAEAVGEVFHLSFFIGERTNFFAEDGFDPADVFGVLGEVVVGVGGAIDGVDQFERRIVDLCP